MKSNSIDTFFLLTRAGLYGRTEGIEDFMPEGVDWEEVYHLAKEQKELGLVADGIETDAEAMGGGFRPSDIATGTAQPEHEPFH